MSVNGTFLVIPSTLPRKRGFLLIPSITSNARGHGGTAFIPPGCPAFTTSRLHEKDLNMLQCAILPVEPRPIPQRIQRWLQHHSKKFTQEIRAQGSIVREIPNSIAKRAGYNKVRIALEGDALVAHPHAS